MTGEAHWLTLAWLAVVGVGALALFFVFFFRLDRRFLSLFRQTKCPVAGIEVRQLVVKDSRTGEFTGVQSCSKFADPNAIACERACLKSDSEKTAREAVVRVPAPGR